MDIAKSPDTQMAAGNDILVSVYCPEYFNPNYENFQCKINVVYNPLAVMSIVAASEGTAILTVFPTPYSTGVHVKGDSIILQDRTMPDMYTGIYTVLDVLEATIPTSQVYLIDLTIDALFVDATGFTDASYTYNFIPYAMEPVKKVDQYLQPGFVNLDISSTLKDFVGTSLLYQSQYIMAIGGTDAFQYGVFFGTEYNFVFNFQDNVFGGTLGFVSTEFTDPDDIPFQVGDVVNVVQEPQNWAYDDNYFASGSLGFTSSTAHNFQVGDQIFVTGQLTPSSNGYANVIAVPSSTTLVTDKTFVSISTEPGNIFGYPTPQYDGVATITEIYYDAGVSGVVIRVNKPWDEGSLAIPGTMKLVDNRKFGNLLEESTINFPISTYPLMQYIHLCRFDLSHAPRYGDYLLMQDLIAGSATSYWSTILTQDAMVNAPVWNKVTQDSPGFLCLRQQPDFIDAPIQAIFTLYTCYDKSGATLGQFFTYIDPSSVDYVSYVPYNLEMIQANANYNDIGSFDLATDLPDIHRFTMQAFSNASDNDYPTPGDEVSTIIRFQMDEDCVQLPTYHLTWLDSFGSYITFPFKYKANESTDVNRSTFYKQETSVLNGFISAGPTTVPVTDSFKGSATRGDNTYYSKSRNSIQLTSGWLKDDENLIFEDLMKSADVYVTVTDPLKGLPRMYACTLAQNSIDYKSNFAGAFIFNYSPEVRLAVNDYRWNNWNPFLQQGSKK